MQGDEFIACRNLIVLYLYDNTLTKMPLLDRNVNLSHLYLQNNRIERIEGLDSLVRLTKLYVFNFSHWIRFNVLLHRPTLRLYYYRSDDNPTSSVKALK